MFIERQRSRSAGRIRSATFGTDLRHGQARNRRKRLRMAESTPSCWQPTTPSMALPRAWSPPAAGAYLRDEIRHGDDGAAALQQPSCVEAGEAERSIVAAWGRASEHGCRRRVAGTRSVVRCAVGLRTARVGNARPVLDQAGGRCANRAQAETRRREAARINPRALRYGRLSEPS